MDFASRFIPESPRWLLSQNNSSKAVEITKKMAKENKKTLSKNIEVRLYFRVVGLIIILKLTFTIIQEEEIFCANDHQSSPIHT